MKFVLAGLILTQCPLCLFLLSSPWSIGEERYVFQKERTPDMVSMYPEPSSEYEQLRRRIKKNIMKFGFLYCSDLEKIQKSVSKYSPELALRIVRAIHLGKEYQITLQSDLDNLQMTDGYTAWREREARELSREIQRRLYHLQNPKDCKSAFKTIVPFPGNGFGSQLHLLVLKFILSYAHNRTMILSSRGWLYTDILEWEKLFYPFSDTCINGGGISLDWIVFGKAQLVILPDRCCTVPNGPYYPRAVPSDVAPRLKRLHGNPFAWWVGQLLKYILRPRYEVKRMVDGIVERCETIRPFVGVHIRRSDKFMEAGIFPVEHYMTKVEDYYTRLELSQDVNERRIYLATDDPEVITEMEEKYRDRYEIFSNSTVASSAISPMKRNTSDSLMGIIFDLFFLSLSDFLVCTLSSNVCRAAYEMMQAFHPDASDKISSLDKSYYYDFQRNANLIAHYPHRTENLREINLNVGDEIIYAVDLDNGYSTGVNSRTEEIGFYPSFKVEEELETFDFPTFSDSTVKKR